MTYNVGHSSMSRTPRVLGSIAVTAACLMLPLRVALAQDSGSQLAVPPPAPVTLTAATTAVLAVDFLQSTCPPNPACVSALPAASGALDAARSANAHVLYSVHLAPDNVIVSQVAPGPTDPIFAAIPGDKFFSSNLDYLLRQANATTLMLMGVTSNSGILYTAAAATQRGYTVVVAEDAIAAANDLSTSVALWQLLHGPGANPQNTPLMPRAVTLTRTDLISYQ
jgi:nicotinamidase-related amidase